MTKVAELIKKSNSNLEKGRAILAKFSEPKKVYTPLIYDGRGDTVRVFYMDQFEGEYEEEFETKNIYAFINEFYCNIIDCQVNGYHEQFIDHTSPADYFEENREEVLTDFLNHKS